MVVTGCSEDEDLTTKTYTVTFDSQGGSEVSNQTVNEGEKVTAPTTPTKVGFTFDAWYTTTDYVTHWDFANDVVTKNLTLYARWINASFTVTFNTNGGTAIEAKEVAEGSILTEVPTPVKEGFIFAGWYTDEALTEEFNAENPIMANLTLYAKWEQEEPAKDVKTLFLETANSLPDENDITVSNFKEVFDKCQKGFEYYLKLTSEEQQTEAIATAYQQMLACNTVLQRDFDYLTYTYNEQTKGYQMKDKLNRTTNYIYEPDGTFPIGLYCQSWYQNPDNGEYLFAQECMILKNDGTYQTGRRYSNESSEDGYPTGGNPTEIIVEKEGIYHVTGNSNSGMLVMQKKQ